MKTGHVVKRSAAFLAGTALLTTGLVGIASPAQAAVTLDLQFQELNFDYANHVNVNPSPGTDCSGSGACTGKNNGDMVLFKNVATIGGTTVDAVVTTALSDAVITKYEAGATSGTPSNFQVDLDTTAANGYAAFTFDFYVADTYATPGQEVVTLDNVQMTGLDIDSNQFNDFTGIQGYTYAAGTNLTVIPGTPGSWPADLRFQGGSGTGTDNPLDQVVVSYASLNSVTVAFGKTSIASPNYFSLAFKALSFDPETTVSFGVDNTVTYEGNGNTGGSVPADQVGKLGEVITLSGNTGSLARDGYTFDGWNTSADGSGTSYPASSAYTTPAGGGTLYAQWTAVSYTVTYDANGSTAGSPPAVQNFDTTTVPVSVSGNSGSLVNAGYVFDGWNTAADGTGTPYASGSSYSTLSNLTLFAQWRAEYAVTYNGNGAVSGVVPAPEAFLNGDTVTILGNTGSLARDGYTFSGWNTSAEGTGTSYPAGATYGLPADVTLYAQWSLVPTPTNGGGGTAVEPPTSVTPAPEPPVIEPDPNPLPAPDPDKKMQKPIKKVTLPKVIPSNGKTAIVPSGIKMNSGKTAKITVKCAPLSASAYTVGNKVSDSLCKVTRTKSGKVTLTVKSLSPVKVTVIMTSSGSPEYNPWRKTKTWVTHSAGLG